MCVCVCAQEMFGFFSFALFIFPLTRVLFTYTYPLLQEPLPETSALWSEPSVTVTPHVSAMSFSWEVADVFSTNLRRFIENGEQGLEHIVDLERGY